MRYALVVFPWTWRETIFNLKLEEHLRLHPKALRNCERDWWQLGARDAVAYLHHPCFPVVGDEPGQRPGVRVAVQHQYELKRGSSQVRRNKSAGPFSSSGAGLHAKTFAIDSGRASVGSFNFDPRSAQLNTELD